MNVLDEKKVEKKMSIPSILLEETYAKNIYKKRQKMKRTCKTELKYIIKRVKS